MKAKPRRGGRLDEAIAASREDDEKAAGISGIPEPQVRGKAARFEEVRPRRVAAGPCRERLGELVMRFEVLGRERDGALELLDGAGDDRRS